MRITRVIASILLVATYFSVAFGSGIGKNLPNPYLDNTIVPLATDTIPITDNYGDHVTDPNKNPFDIKPSIIEEKVEYDPATGHYIIYEKIGDEYYRTPSFLTFEEYLEWNKKKQERDYFNRLAGITSKKSSLGVMTDPMSAIDIQSSIVDRLFGGTEVNIQPQGQVDVTLQSSYFNNFNPAIGGGRRSSAQFNPIDPDVDIRVSVDGNIGEKLNLGFNYDTQSTFDFDRKIKLEYDTEAFGEDDIIKKIEAGNVSLPLRGNLIQGAQSLFGLKTELQFGHLRLTAIASQQQSEQNNLRIENGAAIQEFQMTPDEYDENRHFFLSHYNREAYEAALVNYPQVTTPFRISQLEVWVSNVGQQLYRGGTSPIVALADLGEGDPNKYVNPNGNYAYTMLDSTILLDKRNQLILPDNRVNRIYEETLRSIDGIDSRDKASSLLTAEGFRQNTDFESFDGRKLQPNEYTYNEQLGFLSLNVKLRPQQVLAVSYNYTFTSNCDEVYNVGDLSVNGSQFTNTQPNPNNPNVLEGEAQKVIFTKLLKSSQNATNNAMWDLMMKNVYPLRATQLNPKEFRFDVFYEDDSDGSLKKYLPERRMGYTPLLQLFNLDRLNRFNDPQADGLFDFVPGVTVIPSTGSVVFPVLEPFGSHIRNTIVKALTDRQVPEAEAQSVADFYAFEALYDTSLVIAQQNLQFNKFLIAGEVESATSGEINLGPFVPQGSVRVRAGGVLLVENQDYTVDYSIGRLRIINESYLQQGTPINVSFEDQALFNLQQKTMLGLRADYEFNDNFSVGATYLRLFERPFTEKVNLGNDPINNRIFGLDLAYSDEVPFITKVVDKLPFYSTKEKSSINFTAETAYLKPGHSGAINIDEDGEQEGVVSIDDFEGAINGLLLGGFNVNDWRLASVPSDGAFANQAALNDSLLSGVNRAKMNWYVIDRQARTQADFQSPYGRLIEQTELFNRDVQVGQTELITFDISYYPEERGPYNFDLPNGTPYSSGLEDPGDNGEIRLKDPASRWGGIMRSFQNTDFEAANYEFIEFWMLNPYMDRPDSLMHEVLENGEIIFHLGNVSEDILRDGQQMFENALPRDNENIVPLTETNWGFVPTNIPVSNGFDIENGEEQDIGYDGMNDSLELIKFDPYVQTMRNSGYTSDILIDPAGDNYEFLTTQQDPNLDLLSRYRKFNNPQGNAPIGSRNTATVQRGNRYPESEDMNNNRSLDEGESYYTYKINISPQETIDGLELNPNVTDYITQDTLIAGRDGRPDEKWYRFRIPIQNPDEINNIQGFRSIQFMRMYMTGFESAKTFRLADFQLVRNIWRKSEVVGCKGDVSDIDVVFSVDEVGVEENGGKMPFGYVRPPNIKQERLFSTFANLVQDEKSLSLNFENLGDGCRVAINKLARLDLTLYDKLQLFVHAEADEGTVIPEGELMGFIRFGKDLVNHYYEYEIPLKVSEEMSDVTNVNNIWPDTNFINAKMENFKLAKKMRIEQGVSVTDTFSIVDPDRPDATITVTGTPGLGNIKVFEIGVRNKENNNSVVLNGEVWVNELRLAGLNEKGGLAAQARLQVQMADLGELNFAANYSSIGFGSLDQRLAERQREELLQYDAAASLRLDKFFPNSWDLSIPFYAQYSVNNAYQQFEPFEKDLTVEEKIDALEVYRETVDPAEAEEVNREIEEVKDRSKRSTTIKTYNFTNVKKNGKGGKPWSPSNLSLSYAYTETDRSDAILKEDKTQEYVTTLDYNYSTSSKPIQPFKKVFKSKALRILREFNFNPLPRSFTFSTTVNRLKNTRIFRLPDSNDEPEFKFDDKRFLWDRNYGLNWDFTKSLKFNFRAKATSVVDELRQVGLDTTRLNGVDDRFWVDETNSDTDSLSGNLYSDIIQGDPNFVNQYRNNNIRNLGRSKNYNHNYGLQYTLPIRFLPMMDWVNVKTDLKGEYSWTAGSLQTDVTGAQLPNVISNKQTRSINGTFSFDKLYGKSKYLKKIEKGNKKSRRTRTRTARGKSGKSDKGKSTAGRNDGKDKKKEDRQVTTIERILIRPLLSLRSIKATYKESFGSLIPGFKPESELLGLSSGFSAPGFGFAAGFQPDLGNSTPGNRTDGWLFENQEWFTNSTAFNDQITQNERQDIDVKIKLEPFKDFDIDLDFNKTYSQTHTEVFSFIDKEGGDPGFAQQALYDVGSFEASNMGLSTLFRDNLELYEEFRSSRIDVSRRLYGEREGVTLPDGSIPVDDTEWHSEEWQEYYKGYGPNNYDVSIPAFLATYTGSDVASSSTTLLSDIQSLSFIPKPNWTVKYDGLSKIDMFKDIFSSFTINHSYKGAIQANQWNTTLGFESAGLNQEISEVNDNYYSEFIIPAIAVSDQFSPLIGVNFKTKTDFTFEAEWRKSRQLNLSLEDLRENLSNEFRIGMGYTIKNFRSNKKKKKRRRRGDKVDDDDKDKNKNTTNNRGSRGGVNNNRGKTLTMNLDFSIRDNTDYIYEVSQGLNPEPNGGQRTIQLVPSVDYDVNENLTMRFFFDYNYTESKVTNAGSNRRLSMRGGVTAQLKIN